MSSKQSNADKNEHARPLCSKCQSTNVVKNGSYDGKQRYKCKACGARTFGHESSKNGHKNGHKSSKNGHKNGHESSKNGHESSKNGHESSKNGHKNGHESSKKGHEKIHWETSQGMQVTPAILADILCMPISDLDNLINEMPPHALQNLKLAIEYIFLCHVGVNSEGEPTRLADMKSQKLFYDVRRARADSRKAEITEERERHSLLVDRGQYIEKSKVESRVTNISREFRLKLFALPEKLANKLLSAKTQREVKSIIVRELRKITEEIDKWPIFP